MIDGGGKGALSRKKAGDKAPALREGPCSRQESVAKWVCKTLHRNIHGRCLAGGLSGKTTNTFYPRLLLQASLQKGATPRSDRIWLAAAQSKQHANPAAVACCAWVLPSLCPSKLALQVRWFFDKKQVCKSSARSVMLDQLRADSALMPRESQLVGVTVDSLIVCRQTKQKATLQAVPFLVVTPRKAAAWGLRWVDCLEPQASLSAWH